MEIIVGTPGELPPNTVTDLARYRYEVFVRKLGWTLPTQGQLELDEFDRTDTCYIVARDTEGEIIGTARLLPTDRPYLLASVFPQLLGDSPAPSTPRIWELSRFAAVDLRAEHSGVQGIEVSPTALAILNAAMRAVARRGARRLVSVSPIGIERILRRAGVISHRMGPPVSVDGNRLVACLMEVATRRASRRRPFCAPKRVLRTAADGAALEIEHADVNTGCQAATHVPQRRSCCWPAAFQSRA